MALDFPANPSDGEVFGSYVWSTSKGVWQSREESAAPAVVSPLPPESASPGDIWVDSSDGISYVYYDDGSSGQWIEMISSGVVSLEAATPTGSVIQTARATAPTGWILCEGQEISRAEYSRLFNAIGTAYGSGNGSTTFNVPNLKGRVPVGRDSSQTEFDDLGETGGAKTVTLTEAQLPSHSHTTPNHSHTFSGTTAGESGHTHGVTGLRINDGGAGVQLVAQSDGNVVIYSGGAAQGFGGRALSGNFREWSIGNASETKATTGSSGHTHTYSGTTSNASPTTNTAGSGQSHQNLQPYVVLNYIIKV